METDWSPSRATSKVSIASALMTSGGLSSGGKTQTRMTFAWWIITRLSWRFEMIPKSRIPTHPGEILLEEFLKPLNLTQVDLAAHIGVPVQRVNEIVRGKRGITPETAWLFSQAFGTTPEFWINLQSQS
nr:putative integron gene cassette protein [uncultured bacterium]